MTSAANLAHKGLRKQFGQRTDLPVRGRITDATRREIPRRSAGSARGYQERFASLVAWQSRYGRREAARPYLYASLSLD